MKAKDSKKQKPLAKGRQDNMRAVRPYRKDGYSNMLTKYGTKQDSSESYTFEREPFTPDMQLTSLYEGNGLFVKIIDTPAEEALRHGFNLNLNDEALDQFVEEALDELEWEEKAATAIKWARLYGGSIIVMLINDGKGLEEPVDWENIESIDELRVYERPIVQADYTTLYMQDFGGGGKGKRTSRFGEPEYYYVSSIYGSFTVHESRCLVFRNGKLPEQISNANYQNWGMPEYVRIKRALRETITAHTDATRLLERSVQPVYAMKNLSQILATDEGENSVVKRLQLIDMARNLLNSIAIDADGESYDFKSYSFAGVKDVVDATCNMLSSLTNIPQTILFGRSPAGENATGESDMESYYNFVGRIQKQMLKKNLRYLLDVIFRAGVASGDIQEEPDYKLEFNPLWNMSDSEQATIEQTKAATAMTKAQTAQLYVDMQVLDPTEIRKKLASDDEFIVEDIVDDDDEDFLESLAGEQEGRAESNIEAAEKNLEQEMPAGGEEAEKSVNAEKNVDTPSGKEYNNLDGSAASGNWGHSGRPGKRGGSSAGGGAQNRLVTPSGGYTSRAQAEKENAAREKGKGGTSGGGSSDSNGAWKKSVDEKRAATLALKENMQALEMWKCGYLEKDDALEKLGDGTISEYVNRYYDILEKNGDPTPSKATVDSQKSINEIAKNEYGGDFTAARIGEIKKDTGASDEDAKRYLDAIKDFTAGGPVSEKSREALEEYISKAPAYSGTIMRGMRIENYRIDEYNAFLEDVKNGVVHMRGISSWSSDEVVARMFAHTADQQTNSIVLKCVANRTGTPIEHLTVIGGEQEVTVGGKASWSVLRWKEVTTVYGAKKLEVTVIERGAQYAE